MKQNILNSSIDILKLDCDITTLLLSNKITQIYDLWLLKRSDLRNMSLSDIQINQIIIKLQLFGIDLNKKVYEKIK